MDDLEADLRAAQESLAGAAPAVEPASTPAPEVAPAAPAPEPVASDDGRPRDEHGRFTPKVEAKEEKVLEAVKPPKVAAPQAQQPAQPQAVQAAPTTQAIPAPQNWKGAAKVKWDLLPEPVRKEIAEDYSRLAQSQARLDRLDATIGPERAQVLAATYGTVEQGIQNLFAISDMATKNPQGFVLWFCQQRGINLAQMVGQPQAAQQAPSQAPDPVMQRVGQLEQMLTNFVQQQQGAQTQGLQSEIDRFASDPSHPYFNDVRADMGALIQSGRAKDLQQAYDMAIWAHPEIRNSLIEGQVKQKSEQQSAAAQQARNASVSVSGSPAGAKVPQDEPDETLEQTLKRVQARVLNA